MLPTQQSEVRVITDINVKEHFQQTLAAALARQKVEAEDDTVYYLVNLLEHFAKADNLFTPTADGPRIPPLAWLYGQALEAGDLDTRHRLLQRIGDVALLIGGVFPGSLSRSLVDVDYYIGMGGSAYSYLSDMAHCSRRTRPFKEIYKELSRKFNVFVDVLSEVGESSRLNPAADTLRLYEVWAKTGSSRAAAKLRSLGVEPLAGVSGWRHN